MLRRASYDGISFEVTDSSLSFGRRTVVHDYPQRDMPYVEDLGRATNKITLNGFIIGVDYIEKAKRLIKKIESSSKSNEAKLLVHPWLGSLRVIPTDIPSLSWNTTKRIATFSFTFTEAGEKPKATYSLSGAISNLRQRAEELANKVMPVETINLIQDHIDDVKSVANDIFASLKESQFGVLAGITTNMDLQVKQFWSSLEAGAKQKARLQFLKTLSVAGLIGVDLNWTDLTKSSIKETANKTLKGSAPVIATPETVGAVTTSAMAVEAFKTSTRVMMLSNAVGASSFLKSATNVNAEGTQKQDTDESLLGVRNNLLTALESEMILQGVDNSDLYETLSDTFASVYQGFNALIDSDAVTEKVTLNESTPALVLAYDKYGDSSRVDEISSRNGIVNPLFLPVKELSLSSK